MTSCVTPASRCAVSLQVLEVVASRILVAVTAGVVAGLFAAMLASRALAGFLYGVAPTDAVAFAGAAGLMTLAALTACVIPARRALTMDPALAMRVE